MELRKLVLVLIYLLCCVCHVKCLEKCFCQLEGQVDDCHCNIHTVDHFNNEKMFSLIQDLVKRDYFRYFMYNPAKKCLFWKQDQGHCKSPQCGIKLSSNDAMVDNTLSDEAKLEIMAWQDYDDSLGGRFCDVESDFCRDCVHIDLTLNPERYTGYSGESAHRIWRAVYEENCFNNDAEESGPYSSFILLENMCLEKRIFYRAISGLHSSISIHLTALFPNDPGGNSEIFGFGPNVKDFQRRFDHEKGQLWLRNLYFVYLLELRALSKASSYLKRHHFYTGSAQEEQVTAKQVKDVLDLADSFPDHFDEKLMFTRPEDKTLLREFQTHFLNISRIMDCVGCDKCKLWGKLQITGLGTAFKILFSSLSASILPENKDQTQDFNLSRNEIVALFNSFGRISTSIYQLERFRSLLQK